MITDHKEIKSRLERLNIDCIHYKLYYKEQKFVLYPTYYYPEIDGVSCLVEEPILGQGTYILEDIFSKAKNNGYTLILEICDRKAYEVIFDKIDWTEA